MIPLIPCHFFVKLYQLPVRRTLLEHKEYICTAEETIGSQTLQNM